MTIAKALTDTTADIASSIASQSVTLPTGSGLAHRLVMHVTNEWDTGGGTNPDQATTVSAGWTQIGTTQQVSNITERVQTSTYHALGSVGTTTLTNTRTGAAYQQGYVVAAFTFVDGPTSIDATGTASNSTGAATLTVNAVTVVVNQAWEVFGSADWLGTSAQTATGFTISTNAHANAPAVIGYNTTPKAPGSTGTVTLNAASGVLQIISAQPFALRPQDSPELYGRPDGCRGQAQMSQLLSF